MHPRGFFSYQGCDAEVCYNQRRHACKAASTGRRCYDRRAKMLRPPFLCWSQSSVDCKSRRGGAETTAKMLQSAYKNATFDISFAGTRRASATTARRRCIDNRNFYDHLVLLLEPVERPRRRRGGAASTTKIATSGIYFCWNQSGVSDDDEVELHPRRKLLRPVSIFAGTSRATKRRSYVHNKFCYDGRMILLEPA